MTDSQKCQTSQQLLTSALRRRRARSLAVCREINEERMDGEESCHSSVDDPNGLKRAKRAKMDSTETDRLLNFATAADEYELSLKRQKLPRDPMSHRIIEKRRRDRMNNCLADLSRLIPSSYHKQGQGRIEKTEIIEMAIKHINMLQQRVTDAEANAGAMWKSRTADVRGQAERESKDEKPPPQPPPPPGEQPCCATRFYMGFKEAQDEVMRFLVEVESVSAMDPFCKKIMKHLENASKKFIKDGVPQHCQREDLEKVEGENAGHPQYLQQSSYYASPTPGGGGQMVGGAHDESAEGKHCDKHLRSLLSDQQRVAMSSGQGSGSSVSETGSMGPSMVPMFSYSSQLSGMTSSGDPNGMGSSGYVSDLSNMEKTSPNGSTSSRDNVYKFKHNITKRFSQEGHHQRHHHHHHHHKPQPSDTSSSTSSRDLEDDQSQLKWKGGKHKTRHMPGGGMNSAGNLPPSDMMYQDNMEARSTSNNSANFDEYNSSSVSSDSLGRRNSGKSSGPQISGASISGENRSSGSSFVLPGFILHPSGTHYMPISVHNTNISGFLDTSGDHDNGPPVFHPISIPVHFRRPVI